VADFIPTVSSRMNFAHMRKQSSHALDFAGIFSIDLMPPQSKYPDPATRETGIAFLAYVIKANTGMRPLDLTRAQPIPDSMQFPTNGGLDLGSIQCTRPKMHHEPAR
jgi:hypothetical protein